MTRQRRAFWTLFAVLFALAAPLSAQVSTDLVFPGEEWEEVSFTDLQDYGWSTQTLRQAFTFIRDSANSTGIVVVDRGRVVFEYGDIEELSYLASCRKSILAMLYGYWVENGTIDLERTMADLGVDDIGGLLDIEKQATIDYAQRAGEHRPRPSPANAARSAPRQPWSADSLRMWRKRRR